MDSRPSRFGVGPRIAASALASAALAGLATYQWPDVCRLRALANPVVIAVAVALLAVGVPIWLAGVVAAMRAYNHDQLVTSGVFAVVRHPIYAACIVFNLPALALLTRSWPMLLVPLAAYAVFRASIRREDEYLASRFGPAYKEYRARVPELVPMPWRRVAR